MSKNANYQNKNRKRAYEYFGLTVGNAQGLVLHHKDPDLIVKDIDRYNEWRPEDLVVLTREEHAAIHHTGRKRPDWVGKKISEARKGKKKQGHWYKNEATGVSVYILPNAIIPDGFVLGRILRPETIAKISKAKIRSVPWNKGKCGYMSEEAKAKMREKKLGVYVSDKNPQAKAVCQYTKDGVLIKVWLCMSDAERECGFDRRNIGAVCRGEKKTHKGYIWKYKE
jgi:hypothetical protein